MTLFFQQFVNGIALGSVYSLVALGLTLVYGVLKVPNFAHGALYMAGAYVSYVMLTSFGASYVVAMAVSVAVLAVLGGSMEWLVFRRLEGKTPVHAMIAALGLLFFMEGTADVIWGLAFTERFCGSVSWADRVAEVNGGTRRLLRDVRYRVPYECLLPSYRQELLTALFPEDGAASSGWRHQVRRGDGGQLETLWSIARWFTGSGENYREIRTFNDLKDETIAVGQAILVPTRLLLPIFREPVESFAVASSQSSNAQVMSVARLADVADTLRTRIMIGLPGLG